MVVSRFRVRIQGKGAAKGVIRAVAVVVFFFVGFALPLQASSAPLSLALSMSPLSLPFFVAESEGFYASEGVEVQTTEVLGGHRSMQDMLGGKADLATCSEAVIMFTSFKREDFVVLASFGSSLEDVKILTLQSSKLARPSDLAHHRVGTIVGAASHYYLDMLTLLDGAAPASIEIVDLQPEAMAGALAQGAVDAVAVWQPFAYQAEHNVPGAHSLDDGGFYNLRFNLVSLRLTADQRNGDIVLLMRALNRAQRFIQGNPAKAKQILRARLGIDQAYADWIWPRYRYRLSLDQALITTLESEARWALASGHVSGVRAPNYLRMIQPGPLRAVDPSAVGIVN